MNPTKPEVASLTGRPVIILEYIEAKYDKIILLNGQLTTLIPLIYLDPITTSQLIFCSSLYILTKSLGSCERSASISKIYS